MACWIMSSVAPSSASAVDRSASGGILLALVVHRSQAALRAKKVEQQLWSLKVEQQLWSLTVEQQFCFSFLVILHSPPSLACHSQ
eukprot:CAMPEP_0197638086 /NCGR_PEP_ID=MMETSP1338-20131121/13109_1 /TAXON_ID=43686 ORGANISM="Pelagodinium beii, Strain RCC1491" /NCGR_SAMPLE_ID=MMETSP1338 /ASSEMBLY_ACC=CAM_ASM_000754 /LENGTH=84 /DNA_ID=CAMNT_0043210603 /DNA_START=128 /DNA_END=383 /DNA_ORIENTATION=-